MTGLERLRELARKMPDFDECALMQEINGVGPGGCGDLSCGECRGLTLGKIADQIERETAHDPSKDVSMSAYDLLPECDRKAISLALDCGGVEEIKKRLMPAGMEWPRFEDGEPVRLGDEVADETGIAQKVDSVQMMSNSYVLYKPFGVGIDQRRYGERVKRPAIKALDADGVEIHVGDTVCGTRDMEPMRVVDTDSRECGFKRIKCEKEGDGFFFYCADELTHKLPVLAADGKPLREGEEVWSLVSGERFIITSIDAERGWPHVSKDGKEESSFPIIIARKKLTHERPDSWERLEADAKAWVNPTMEERADLVRRAKKLAGAS